MTNGKNMLDSVALHLDERPDIPCLVFKGVVEESQQSLPPNSIPAEIAADPDKYPMSLSVILLKATTVNVTVLCRRGDLGGGSTTLAALEVATLTMLLRLCRVCQYLDAAPADRPAALSIASVAVTKDYDSLLF